MQFISTVGFPIFVACWFMYYTHIDNQKTLKMLQKLSDNVENNTRVLEDMKQNKGV